MTLWLLISCAPGEANLRPLAQKKLGEPHTLAIIGYQPAEAACSCGPTPSFAGEAAAVEAELVFEGTSHLDGECLESRGFLEKKQTARRSLPCSEQRLEALQAQLGAEPGLRAFCSPSSDALSAAPAEEVTVLVPTETLGALEVRREGRFVEYRVATEVLREMVSVEKAEEGGYRATFATSAEETELEPCLAASRRKKIPRDKEVSYLFQKVDGAWR